VGLYAYCYSMSAVLLRVTLLGSQFRSSNTWLLALLLTGLGSVLPYLVAYFFYPKMLHNAAYERALWNPTNPFVSIDEAMSHRRRSFRSSGSPTYPSSSSGANVFDAPCLPVLAWWAGAVTLLSVPWVVRQAGRFRPLTRWPLPVTVFPEVEEPPRSVADVIESP